MQGVQNIVVETANQGLLEAIIVGVVVALISAVAGFLANRAYKKYFQDQL